MINNLNVQKNECNCNIENGKKIMEMLETERKRIDWSGNYDRY